MAKREQDHGGDFSYHDRKPRSLKEQQEFIVSSFPTIGVHTAQTLLLYFGSIKGLVNATREELLSIDGVGEKTADRLLELFQSVYAKEK